MFSSWSSFFAAVFGLWVVLYVLSERVRYVTKFGCFVAYVSFVAAVLLPTTFFRPGSVKNANLSTWMVSWCAPLMGVSYRIIGAEHLAKDRAAVVICNHQSMLDFLGMCFLWPVAGKLAAVAKREILFVFPFGLIAWLSGTVFINRKLRGESQEIVSSMEDKIKREKIKLWVFAEGTRSSQGHLLPFKKGGFHLARQGNLPIIPVVMSWYGSFLDHRAMKFGRGEVTIKILPAVEFPQESTDVDVKTQVYQLTEKVRSDMQETLLEISPGLKLSCSKENLSDGDKSRLSNGN